MIKEIITKVYLKKVYYSLDKRKDNNLVRAFKKTLIIKNITY